MSYIYKEKEDYDSVNCCPAPHANNNSQYIAGMDARPYPMVEPVGYVGTNTKTAKTIVCDRQHTISVDVNLKEVNKPFIFTQSIPAKVWNITHNLGRIPHVTIINSNGEVIIGEIRYMSNDVVKLEFSEQITGSAYLN